MDEKIDKAIEVVLGMVRTNLKPEEAMKVTQAALNLMGAKTQWEAVFQSTRARSKSNRENTGG